MNTTDMNLEIMMKQGKNIIKIANELDEYVKEYELVIQKLEESWTGIDSYSIIEKMRKNHEENLTKFNKALKTYGVYITKIVTLHSMADKVFSFKIIK